jgi:hypothetical protein
VLQSQLEISLKAPGVDKLHYARESVQLFPSQDWQQRTYRNTHKAAHSWELKKMFNLAVYRTELRQQEKSFKARYK